MAANDSHLDGNRQATGIGVIGTLGTADVKGSALTLPIAVDPTTGAQYVNNIGAPSGNPSAGTLNFIGTVGTLQLGTVVVNSIGTLGTLQLGTVFSTQTVGTVNTGTINTGTINAGTVTATVTTGTINAGTINAGTVTATVTVGTVGGKAASGAAAAANPVQIAGTDSGGTIYSPLVTTAGIQSANMPSGTLNVGTINTGTVTATVTVGTINAGTINVGTVFNTQTVGTTNVGTMNTGTVNTGTINVATVTAGSIIVTLGTVTSTQTVGTTNTGTMNTGTVNTGTFQQNVIPTLSMTTWGTLGTTGASIFGTIAGGTGSGAGTEIFVTSVSLSVPSTAGSQNVSVGFGTNGGTFHAGTGALINGNFPPGGGIQKAFMPAMNSGTNGQLTYFQAGAGTVYVNATYVVTPSSL